MSRTRAQDETCLECENHIAAHEGPPAPAEFEYLVREIASALVEVGRGSTYKDAALRVRAMANVGKIPHGHDPRLGREFTPKVLHNGQTVSDWLPDFEPVVSARYEEKAWPDVIVLDSIPLSGTNPMTGKSFELYNLIAAFGYDKDGSNPRLVKIVASPEKGKAAWAEFLALLPGKPLSIVADQDSSITAGVNIRWGRWAAVNLVHHCEHHIREVVKEQFQSDQLAPDDPARLLFRGALTTPEKWAAFIVAVKNRPELVLTNQWIARNDILLRGQIQGRASIPPVYSNSRVEQELREFKANIRPRAATFRNRKRLDHLLNLMRLASLKVDNATNYTADIRIYLEANGGRPARSYRETYDPKTEERFSSLWRQVAQEAFIEKRRQREIAASSRI